MLPIRTNPLDSIPTRRRGKRKRRILRSSIRRSKDKGKMQNICAGKYSWPELLGVEGEKAATIIESENPTVKARIVEDGKVVIQDFRCDRVWVWVDRHGVVARVPHIG
ncbi:hypothetical protein C4D60_Mb04t13350 [Musa balbisiana]|uniref:Uncharacterized protein n=1 Tax=Musa balbisiana TaxID=52838 RepID=A0A4S8KBR2_MUSBA|nr:hypothetical protein C4D60_Mb04t13350 [Musa balbisiana]